LAIFGHETLLEVLYRCWVVAVDEAFQTFILRLFVDDLSGKLVQIAQDCCQSINFPGGRWTNQEFVVEIIVFSAKQLAFRTLHAGCHQI
jgi:hypothetical protein